MSMDSEIQYIINRLNLKPLTTEGGLFCETYRSDEIISPGGTAGEIFG